MTKKTINLDFLNFRYLGLYFCTIFCESLWLGVFVAKKKCH